MMEVKNSWRKSPTTVNTTTTFILNGFELVSSSSVCCSCLLTDITFIIFAVIRVLSDVKVDNQFIITRPALPRLVIHSTPTHLPYHLSFSQLLFPRRSSCGSLHSGPTPTNPTDYL